MYTKAELAWKRLSGLYGYTMSRQYGTEPTAEWLLAFDKLSVDQIARGLERCCEDKGEFPPSPVKFMTLCMPSGEDCGLPSEDEALLQATGGATIKCPAVVFTLRNMGNAAFDLRRADSKRAAAMFSPRWAATIQHVMAGGELPEPAPEIDHQHTKADRAEGNSFLAEMRAEVGAS